MLFDTFPTLMDDKLILHRLTIDDAERLNVLKSEEDVYRYEPTFLPELLCPDTKQFILKECDLLLAKHENVVLGAYSKDNPEVLIGLVELYGYSIERKKISIGIRFVKECWNQGYASSAIGLLKEYSLSQPDCVELTAHIRVENVGSAKAFLKNDFGKRGETHEEDWGGMTPVLADVYLFKKE